ncbi:aspartate aminotransferase family protein [Chromobacterium subtsugae]|uniref:Aspartate aminotransferase family protein n=1 Tax=Chromobacterium subtsugae TaxID=251747 RepID=A0ABS7FM86_9NEIS|nr:MULTISPECIES: aspartate aminotransferase family protein [Chromobacterium]KUM02858.1 aminotransferase [Chromobacterium subtsugae]KZE87013.1 aminotransferase [Chromobacterium sp. F49]MBW7568595.1 aspartate aminotransferase family protein [Chromobacterium subtsugae]MBW8290379.1 aspartate aminotransferase family protein [Chromobacterium subtsugae]WSE93581.1 aspartate aminotransferase family protein [Chromobacterium subtsugae]
MAVRHGIDLDKARAWHEREIRGFLARHPRSLALSERGRAHLLFGVPLHWMDDWPTPCSLFIAEARDAALTDADGLEYVDFCLGDTGAMFGHSPAPVAAAIAREAARGLTAMLPGEDALWVAEELSRRFGMAAWQFTLSASDANRFAIRWARAMTGRDQILVFNGCYHGTVDDVFVDLVDGAARPRASLLGQVYPLTEHTRVAEFNDLAALDAALADGRVACVLAEPAMTNIGMVLPDPGYWEQAQAIIRRRGSLLLLDETHTISCGPGGYAAAHGLAPDLLVLGKPLAGGLPAAAYGFSAELAQRAQQAKRAAPPGHSGIGTTLSANRLACAAMRANLAEVMTEDNYRIMFERAGRLAQGLRELFARRGLPWCVTQLGARCEFQFAPRPPRNGSEAGAWQDEEFERCIHLHLLNRGLLITPFHNMLLMSPSTAEAGIARLLQAFDDWLDAAQA